jgi:hypothetical protein
MTLLRSGCVKEEDESNRKPSEVKEEVLDPNGVQVNGLINFNPDQLLQVSPTRRSPTSRDAVVPSA